MAGKAPKFVIPKKLGEVADLLFKIKAMRSKASKSEEELHTQQTLLEAYIIKTLPKSATSGVAGKFGRVRVETKDVPTVKDWKALRAYILKTKDFDLLQKRLSNEAVLLRWDAKKVVPGVKPFKVTKVSCVKA